jgi:hypothetical protein
MARRAAVAARALVSLVIAMDAGRGAALAQPAPYRDRGPTADVTFDVNTDGESNWLQLTPTGGFAWGRRWSAEMGLPIFHLAGSATETGVAQTGIGDLYASLSFDVSGARTTAYLTGTLGLPTGDAGIGLGAGTPTWDASGYVDLPWGSLTPSLDVGVGNNGLVAAPSPGRQLFQAPGALFHAEAWVELALGRALRLATGVYAFRSIASTAAAHPEFDEDSADDKGYQFLVATDLTPALELSVWVSRSVTYAYNTYAVSLGVDIVRVVSAARRDRSAP